MSEMVERVAQAMFSASGMPFTHYAMGSDLRNGYYVFARAAIEAMREPTEAMAKMGEFRCHGVSTGDGAPAVCARFLGESAEGRYQLMIDEALK